jgi:hypothetical protein
MQIEIDLCYKTDEGREEQSREHTSRHTSPEDGELADSPKAPSSSSVKAPCLHPAKIDTSIIKKLKERALTSQGSCPLLQFSDLLLRLGAGVRSR